MIGQTTISVSAAEGRDAKIETVSAWTARLQTEWFEQKRVGQESERAERERAEQSRSQGTSTSESGGRDAGRISSSGKGDAEHVLLGQLASFGELDELTRKNHETLEEVQRLFGKLAAGTFATGGTELTDVHKLRELNRLLAMAKTIEEIAVGAVSAIALGRRHEGLETLEFRITEYVIDNRPVKVHPPFLRAKHLT